MEVEIIFFQKKYQLASSHLDKKLQVNSQNVSQIIMNLKFLNPLDDCEVYLVAPVDNWSDSPIFLAKLAISWAKLENKILIIDANLRNPSQHVFFNLNRDYGLTNALSDLEGIEKYIQVSVIERISVLTAGEYAPNPVELLNSKKMNQLIVWAKKNFDLVLVNVPPFLEYTDGRVVALQSDQIVLLTKFGKTKNCDFRKVVNLLKEIEKKKTGVIVIE